VGGSASAVLLTADPSLASEVERYDLEAVLVAADAALATYTPGAYVSALEPAIRAASPAYVLAPHTCQSVDFVPRLAQAVDAVLVPEVTGFESVNGELLWKRWIMGDRLRARFRVRGEGMVVVTVKKGAFPPNRAALGRAETRKLDFGPIQADREILGVEPVSAEKQKHSLTDADIIVSVGRGVGGEDKLGSIRALAEALGADIGASRPVVDSGWLPRDRQIGSAGQVVAPKLYLALGISGAIQHVVGMRNSGCIVAINKDAAAPIFSIADYAVVGDLHEIVPALLEALAEE
jgi:electron transfer flavoprotein alpha subunit